jgi:hypothetical protein
MATVITPTNQNVVLNHSEDRIFDFNNINSRFYLGHQGNAMLRLFEDSILDGLEINEFSFTDNVNIQFKITPGNAIIDSTLIKYNDENIINFDTTSIDFSTGFLVVYISFKFLYITNKNYSLLSCVFVNNDNSVPDRSWVLDKGNVILDCFTFDNTNQTIQKILNPLLNPTSVNIMGRDYYIRPLNSLWKRMLNLLNHTFN